MPENPLKTMVFRRFPVDFTDLPGFADLALLHRGSADGSPARIPQERGPHHLPGQVAVLSCDDRGHIRFHLFFLGLKHGFETSDLKTLVESVEYRSLHDFWLNSSFPTFAPSNFHQPNLFLRTTTWRPLGDLWGR